MPFQIRVPDAVDKKITSWNLGSRLRKLLYQTIRDELIDRPDDAFAREIVAPVRCVTLPITVDDPETGKQIEFMLWVNITAELGVRVILDCDRRRSPPS